MAKESRSKTTDPVLREKRINPAMTWAKFSALYACEEFHSLVEAYRQTYYAYDKAQDKGAPEGTTMTHLAEAEEDTALELARLVSVGVLPDGGRAW